MNPPARLNDPPARAELLRRLPALGFVPPPEWLASVCDAPAADDALRRDVECFAANFWAWPPGERRDRWQQLLDRAAADPPAAARLRRLEAGLDQTAADRGDGTDRAAELARHVQELFALKPAARAGRRAELSRSVFLPHATWEGPARTLRSRQPALAALDPVVDRLAAQPRPGLGKPQATPKPASHGVPGWFLLIGIVLSAGVRTCDTADRSPTPAYRYQPPVFRPPQTQPFVPLDTGELPPQNFDPTGKPWPTGDPRRFQTPAPRPRPTPGTQGLP